MSKGTEKLKCRYFFEEQNINTLSGDGEMTLAALASFAQEESRSMSYFSLLRIRCDKSKCISCDRCKKVCPMDVDVTDNSRSRKNGTECILCFECVKNCPQKAL